LEAVLDGDDGNGDAPLFGADADVLAVQEVEVEVAVELAPPPAKLDTRLEASSGEMVWVVGGNVAVDPGERTIVKVTVPSPLAALLDGFVPFEVLLDVSPP
jgi:hypothetical protein